MHFHREGMAGVALALEAVSVFVLLAWASSAKAMVGTEPKLRIAAIMSAVILRVLLMYVYLSKKTSKPTLSYRSLRAFADLHRFA
jgi:hypothetical protein